MKKKIANFAKAVCFMLVCALCISLVSRVFTYENGMENGKGVREFYKLDKDEIQVLVVGSSHTGLGFSPIRMYKTSQITSYNLSSQKQPIELSYYLMEEAFKTQSPKVVIYDVASLFYEEDEILPENMRIVMDSMPLSATKFRMSKFYAQESLDETPKIFKIAEGLVPLYYYHDRWNSLTKKDFTTFLQTELKGQAINTCITQLDYSREEADEKVKSGEWDEPEISKGSMDYLINMIEICKENDSELVLCTTPTMRWTTYKENQIKEICEKYNLKFIDPTEGVVDYSVDMKDENHVNAIGAEKVTDYFTKFIEDNFGLEGKEDEWYEESIGYYDAYSKVYDYELETDFDEYLEKLVEDKDGLLILMASDTDTVGKLNKKEKKLLSQLGIESEFTADKEGYAFASIIDGGNVIYDKLADEELYKYTDVTTNIKAKVYSKGSTASIMVDNSEYAINTPGLNILVYDKESGCILDSVAFDTASEELEIESGADETTVSDKITWNRGSDYNDFSKQIFTGYRNWVIENR